MSAGSRSRCGEAVKERFVNEIPHGVIVKIDDALAGVTPSPDATRRARQCTAAYMVFSTVASAAENSSTTRPWRITRMRSASAITSGR